MVETFVFVHFYAYDGRVRNDCVNVCSRNQETIGIWYNASVRKYQILLTRSVAVYVATEQKIAFVLWSRLRIFPFWTKNRNYISLDGFFSLSLSISFHTFAFCCNAKNNNQLTTRIWSNVLKKKNTSIRFHTFSIYWNRRYIERMQRKRISQNDCRFIC